jgi:hypothetical protein
VNRNTAAQNILSEDWSLKSRYANMPKKMVRPAAQPATIKQKSKPSNADEILSTLASLDAGITRRRKIPNATIHRAERWKST